MEGLLGHCQHPELPLKLEVLQQVDLVHLLKIMQAHPTPDRIPDHSAGEEYLLDEIGGGDYFGDSVWYYEVGATQPSIYDLAESLWSDYHVCYILYITGI